MRRALILSGGGGKGAFEVGAIDFLVKAAGLDFHIFIGSSVGALNAAILGMATNYRELLAGVRELKKLWEEIKGNEAIFQSYPLGVFDLFTRNALYNPCGLRGLIKDHIDPVRLCRNTAKFVLVPAVAIETGELFYADSRTPGLQNTIQDYILASASIPLFFPPVLLNGKHWYDGGLRDVTPLAAAFKEQPDEIYLVLTFPVNENLEPILNEAPYGGVLKSLLRIVSIMTNELCANDLQISKYAMRSHPLYFGRRRIPIYIIAPPTQLGGSALDFKPAKIKENIRLGYEAAQNLKKLPLST